MKYEGISQDIRGRTGVEEITQGILHFLRRGKTAPESELSNAGKDRSGSG